MKKLVILIITTITMILWTHTALATSSATIYVSPSSQTVTKGNNFSVSIRINSHTNRVDTVGATLNYSSRKVQYLSYSGSGSGFTTDFGTSGGSSSFSTTRTKLGSYTTGDKLIATITFKALSTGTASMSLSSVSSVYSGSALSTSASSGSVNISNPSSSTSGGSSTSGTSYDYGSGTGSSSSITDGNKDTTPPKLIGSPTITPDYGNIKVDFKTSESAKAVIKYGTTSKNKQTTQSSLSKSQEIIIGKNDPLIPGTKYSFVIELTDKTGNKSTSKVYGVSTKGYTVQLTITDSKGNPVANQEVTLHSDPIQATTDSNGVAIFNNVAPGKHSITFDIDGVTVEQELTVANSLNLSGNENNKSSSEQKLSIKLPFALNLAASPRAKSASAITLIAIGVIGLIAGAFLTLYRHQILDEVKQLGLNFHEWHKKKLDESHSPK